MNITTIEQTINGRHIFKIPGVRYFRLLETVNPVNVQLGRGGKAYESLESVEAGAWARIKAGDADLDTIVVTTVGSEAVKFVVSDGEAGYDRLFTALSQARTLTVPGNATVGTAAASILAAATRSKAMFHADAANAGVIALGPAGVTLANAVIVLSPGDVWIEEASASAQWYAVASVAAQTLRLLTAV